MIKQADFSILFDTLFLTSLKRKKYLIILILHKHEENITINVNVK